MAVPRDVEAWAADPHVHLGAQDEGTLSSIMIETQRVR